MRQLLLHFHQKFFDVFRVRRQASCGLVMEASLVAPGAKHPAILVDLAVGKRQPVGAVPTPNAARGILEMSGREGAATATESLDLSDSTSYQNSHFFS